MYRIFNIISNGIFLEEDFSVVVGILVDVVFECKVRVGIERSVLVEIGEGLVL